MTVGSFVGIGIASRHQPLDRFSIEKLRLGRHLFDRAAIDANVRNRQFADVAQTRIDHFTQLSIAQRNRHLSLNRNAEHRSADLTETESGLLQARSRRLLGDYLAIVTLFFGQAFVVFVNNANRISFPFVGHADLTGGSFQREVVSAEEPVKGGSVRLAPADRARY